MSMPLLRGASKPSTTLPAVGHSHWSDDGGTGAAVSGFAAGADSGCAAGAGAVTGGSGVAAPGADGAGSGRTSVEPPGVMGVTVATAAFEGGVRAGAAGAVLAAGARV